jgi:hypothetical protein
MRRADFGYFSLSKQGSETGDHDYLTWHLLDHMPEQWQIPGIAWGQRWASTPACRAARAAEDGQWADMVHVNHYLMSDALTGGEPIERTLDAFFTLAQKLRDQGRFAYQVPSLFQGALRVLETYAAPGALVLPDVVPFRMNRGIYMVLEEVANADSWDAYLQRSHSDTMPELLTVSGVGGAWVFATTPTLQERAIYTAGRFRITLLYLDAEPVDVAERLAEPLRRSWEQTDATLPLLAAPFESMVKWDWNRF